MTREKGRLWRVSLNAPSCWQRADVPIPFNEQISGLPPKSNEKQHIRECTISSDLLLLLQIKPLRCESRWYLRCSDPDARDDLCLNPLLLFRRCAGFTGGLNACCFISLTQFYHFCHQSASIYPFFPAAVMCVLWNLLFFFSCSSCCRIIIIYGQIIHFVWKDSMKCRFSLTYIFVKKMPGWPVPPLPRFHLLSGASHVCWKQTAVCLCLHQHSLESIHRGEGVHNRPIFYIGTWS